VDTEHLINAAADASGGKWDVVTMNPAMICGPILFKAQVGQWIEQIGRLAACLEPTWPTEFDMYYNIIDVRDLVKAHRLAAESSVDHKATAGGARYLMHGSGGRSSIRLGTEVAEIIHGQFPTLVLGKPPTPTDDPPPVSLRNHTVNDCKKAKSVLGATIRPVEETICDVVDTSISMGIIEPQWA
jgi:nucleoside-diphosphate-sugar epimerase